MLVNDEYSSWYNRVGNFFSQFGIGQRKFCMMMDQHASSVESAPLQSASSMALSAVVV